MIRSSKRPVARRLRLVLLPAVWATVSSLFPCRAGARTVRPAPSQGAVAERFLYAFIDPKPGHEPDRR